MNPPPDWLAGVALVAFTGLLTVALLTIVVRAGREETPRPLPPPVPEEPRPCRRRVALAVACAHEEEEG